LANERAEFDKTLAASGVGWRNFFLKVPPAHSRSVCVNFYGFVTQYFYNPEYSMLINRYDRRNLTVCQDIFGKNPEGEQRNH
jgi:hypothetical protein